MKSYLTVDLDGLRSEYEGLSFDDIRRNLPHRWQHVALEEFVTRSWSPTELVQYDRLLSCEVWCLPDVTSAGAFHLALWNGPNSLVARLALLAIRSGSRPESPRRTPAAAV